MSDSLEALRAALADRYDVERELGSGGMATVYLARDRKHERQVAIKVLHPELAETLGAARFLREVTIAANLTHPHILPLHDSGEADGLLYYVMPYIEGESLRNKLFRDGKLPVQEAARLLWQVADALSYAHSRGIVHRDIKPDNVLLSGRNVMIADFGIARAVSQASDAGATAGSPDLTKLGVSIGTPAYMPPEQAAGELNIDHRADIYSFGAMAFEMLTGSPPFPGDTAQAILAAHLTQKPKPISEHQPSIPSELSDLVMKCLAKMRADRWESVDQFLPQLEALAAADTTALMASRTTRNRVTAGATLVFLAGAAWWFANTYSGKRELPQGVESLASIAVLPFSDLSEGGGNEFFGDGLAEELLNSLSKLGRLRVAGRTSSFSFKDRNEDIRSIGEQLNVGSVLEGSVRRAGNRIRITAQLINVADGFQLWSETYDRELEDIFAVQEDVARSIVAALEVELSAGADAQIVRHGTDNVAAYNSYLLGRFHWNKRAAADLVTAASHFEDAVDADSTFAAAWSGLADSYILFPPYGVETVSWEEAIGRAERAARRAITADSNLAEAHASLGIVLDAKWDWEGAEDEFSKAIALNAGYPTAHQWYGIFLVGLNRIEEGLAEIRLAEELDPLSPIIGTWVALALDVAGETEAATDQFEKILALHPSVGLIHRDAWLHFLRSSQYEPAALHLQRYLELSGSAMAEVWPAGVLDGEARAATLREIANEFADDFKMSTDLNMILGEEERALRYLTFRLAAPDKLRDSAGALRAYVLSEDLRNDPRFRALLGNMGLD